MLSFKEVDSLFKNFSKQTYTDSLKIAFEDGEIDYRISLNYIIEGNRKIKKDSNPTLHISNYKVFIEKLTELLNKKYKYHYVDKSYMMLTEEGYHNFILMSTICNMQEMDFNNPIDYLDRMNKAYDVNYDINRKKDIGIFKMGDTNVEIYQYDKKNMSTMESMVSRHFIMKKGNEEVLLPKIHYYISDDKVYLMGIQSNRKKELNTLSKKLDRYLRKMDKGLDKYARNEEGKVESIKDISVSALASLTLFLSSMREYKEFYMVDYLPIRYMNKMKNNISYEETEEVDRIQTNVTNKFLMTGIRLCEHFDNLDYDFFNGLLKIEAKEYKHQQDNIIYDLYEAVNKTKKR